MSKNNYHSIVLTLGIITASFSSLSAVQPVVEDMQQAAVAFLDSLSPELKQKATFPLNDDERVNWHFVPKTGERNGVNLKELDEAQEARLADLLASSLSPRGHNKVKNIQSLESVLFMLEKADHRDPELYYTTIFGDPENGGNWGWRLEGHHLSLNYTIAGGKLLAVAPNFWGANPAKVPQGPREGLRTLKGEEDLAREFVLSLTDTQRKIAIIADKAPKDIYTGADKSVTPLEAKGIKVSQLEKSQLMGFTRIINEYLQNMPADVASSRWEKLSKAGMDDIQFAWAGSTDVGEAHYYRIQGPTFLIEYDNIQNKANHIHAVWRDFDGDFGRDILKEHHMHSH